MVTFIRATFMLLLLTTFVTASTALHLLSDEFIALINSKQNSWKAGRNFPTDTPMEYIKSLMGAIKDDNLQPLPVKKHHADLIASLPDSFDSREKWTNCPSLNEIRDQGACQSSWALAPVEVMTDRVCIYSNGTKNVHYSGQDLLSCIRRNIDIPGCYGGIPEQGFVYWRDVGIVSGGSYNSSEGCRPYEIATCDHHMNGARQPCGSLVPTPECTKKCIAGYNVEYEKDKHRGKNVYTMSSENDIKAELFLNGPVVGVFVIFEDFLSYKSGVYVQTEGQFMGFHVIKILGWGVEGGQKYWLTANSWNTDWGDNGFVKFLRGVNQCNLENEVVTGEPALEDM